MKVGQTGTTLKVEWSFTARKRYPAGTRVEVTKVSRPTGLCQVIVAEPHGSFAFDGNAIVMAQKDLEID